MTMHGGAPFLRTGVFSLLLVVLVATSCSDAPGDSGGALSDKDALKLGSGLASTVAQSLYGSREMLVKGVYAATVQGRRLGGPQVVNTGTLTQNAFGGFQYSAEPKDRLVIRAGQAVHEFVVGSVEGNMQALTPEAFLGSNHRMTFTYRIPEVCELKLKANRLGMGWAAHADGWYVHETKRYEIALKAEGGDYFEQSGRSGQESKTDYKVKGTIKGKGVTLTVDERHFFHLVSLHHVVTHSIDECRNTLVAGDTTYKWVDASVTKIFHTKQGGRMLPPFDAGEKWKATGKVLRNGKPFGTYKLGVGSKSVDANRKYHGTIDIEIKTPKETVTLQSFRGS
ncbi:MAG: hypothetical protein QNJ98_11855 [Planctomycetota bacterium]|nr:hypothetical protein [Planctomycetota bacterium]